MEILIKESEYRFMPLGHVYSTTINSVSDVIKLYPVFSCDEGKRAGRAFFKLNDDSEKWFELTDFIMEYFSGDKSEDFPEYKLIGFENEDGEIE